MDLEALKQRWHSHIPQPLGVPGRNAVLVPLVERPEGLSLLFQVRADTLRRQPGEVCFPGGRMEMGENPVTAALRETEEELAIPPAAVEVLGPMDYLIHQGKFLLYPVLARVDAAAAAALVPAAAEVKEVFYVPLAFFCRTPPRCYGWDMVPQVAADFPYEELGIPRDYHWRHGWSEVPVYRYEGHTIWGLTARIVRALVEPDAEGGARRAP